MNPREAYVVDDSDYVKRQVLCVHYAACLDYADAQGWAGFSCGDCVDYERMGAGDPEYILEDMEVCIHFIKEVLTPEQCTGTSLNTNRRKTMGVEWIEGDELKVSGLDPLIENALKPMVADLEAEILRVKSKIKEAKRVTADFREDVRQERQAAIISDGIISFSQAANKHLARYVENRSNVLQKIRDVVNPVPASTSEGDKVIAFLRAQEVRSVFRGMDDSARLEAIKRAMKTGNTAVLKSLLSSLSESLDELVPEGLLEPIFKAYVEKTAPELLQTFQNTDRIVHEAKRMAYLYQHRVMALLAPEKLSIPIFPEEAGNAWARIGADVGPLNLFSAAIGA